MITIERTSHDDWAAMEAIAELMGVVYEHDHPKLPRVTPRACYLWHKVQWPGQMSEHNLAFRDGEAVGRAEISFPTLDNLSNADLKIEVLPTARRQGIGRELYSFVLQRVAADGRTTVMAHTAVALPGMPTHDEGAGSAFAQVMGLHDANFIVVERRLDLSTVDNAALDAMSRLASGYRLVQWHADAPEIYIDDVAYLDGRLMRDVPTGDLALEAEKVDAKRIRANEAAKVARGYKSFNTGAVHEASNRLVAWTGIGHDPEVPWHAWQGITIVDPEHRGHRLGALVKVANLRLMQAGCPGVTTVDTSNAAANSYMIAINEQMGFQPLCAWQNWQREL